MSDKDIGQSNNVDSSNELKNQTSPESISLMNGPMNESKASEPALNMTVDLNSNSSGLILEDIVSEELNLDTAHALLSQIKSEVEKVSSDFPPESFDSLLNEINKLAPPTQSNEFGIEKSEQRGTVSDSTISSNSSAKSEPLDNDALEKMMAEMMGQMGTPTSVHSTAEVPAEAPEPEMPVELLEMNMANMMAEDPAPAEEVVSQEAPIDVEIEPMVEEPTAEIATEVPQPEMPVESLEMDMVTTMAEDSAPAEEVVAQEAPIDVEMTPTDIKVEKVEENPLDGTEALPFSIDINTLKSENILRSLQLELEPDEPHDPTNPQKKLEFEAAQELYEGQTFSSYNKVIEGLALYPNSLQLRHVGALALLKTGCVDEAKEMLSPLLAAKNWDWKNPNFEALSADLMELCANIFKESWRASHFQNDLLLSQKFFKAHFEKSYSLNSAVHAASLGWFLGQDEEVKLICNTILEQTKNHQAQDEAEGTKSLLAQGMAYLFLEEIDLSQAMLARAQDRANKDYALIVQTLHHLKFLHEGGYFLPQEILNSLTPPTIVVFAGQPIDALDAPLIKFPQELEPFIYKRIVEKLDGIQAAIGYTGATSGSDILFIEAMLARGAEVNIIIPFDIEDFIICNVRPAGPRWESRFRSALARASSVTMATEEKYLGHDMLYRFSNMVLHGLAEIRGDFLLSSPHLVAVWDSRPDSIVGGASDFIDHWADIRTLHLIDLDEVKEEMSAHVTPRQLPVHLKVARERRLPYQASLAKTPRIIKAMLFADFSGFSKLKEEHMPGFLAFLKDLKEIMEQVAPKPDAINTWGDALFVVMDEASVLAEYALRLSELVPKISADLPGLPTIHVRTSLHAGPVYESIDPFRHMPNYYGGHITRAARLEPVTVIDQVYTTEQFMALFTAEQSSKRVESHQEDKVYVEKFTCQYVGRLPLAKGFGAQPIYHLRRL